MGGPWSVVGGPRVDGSVGPLRHRSGFGPRAGSSLALRNQSATDCLRSMLPVPTKVMTESFLKNFS